MFETDSWSTDNEAGLATGWRDGRLAEYGRHQAAELGLGRAVETGEIAFAGSTIPVQRDSRLCECN